MKHEDLLKGLSYIAFKDAIGNRLMREFVEDDGDGGDGIYCGREFSSFARLSVYLENKYSITSVKLIQNSHVYELLEYMRLKGFKDATLKSYITAFRYVYKEYQHLFSDEFTLPTNAAYEQYRQEIKLRNNRPT